MDDARARDDIGLAGSALVLTSAVALAAKIAGVVIAPGARGAFGEKTVVLVETVTGALAYTLAALLVALVCGASFELARTRKVNVLSRGGVVAVSGLIVALASPAVVERLATMPSLALGLITSVVVLTSGITTARVPRTRAMGAVLSLLAVGGMLRVIAYELSAYSVDSVSPRLHDTARVLSTVSVSSHAFAALVAAAWIGTRSQWRGRILANLAILVAFGLTWLAARGDEQPTALESILRASLPAAATITPAPYLLGSIAAFLVPAAILLAGVALLQSNEPPAFIAPVALALLSGGVFDVPLHALLATAGAQWALLALTLDEGPRAASRVPRGAHGLA